MNPIAYITSDLTKVYNDFGLFSRIKDRLKIRLDSQAYIKEFDLKILNMYVPPNLNESAYMNNIRRAAKYLRNSNVLIAPKISRILDYRFFNDFEMNLFGYSVIQSTRLILRSCQKSIRESCIILYDAAEPITEPVIQYLAKEARYVILVSEDTNKLKLIQEYTAANYGISVVTTTDIENSIKFADFIITTRDIDRYVNIPVWYLNNLSKPFKKTGLEVNDISFKVPWDFYNNEMSLELLGALLSQTGEKDVEKALRRYEIYIHNFTFGGGLYKAM